MAGTEVIYRLTFDDYCDNAISVLIKQDGYAGSETEVKGGTAPCIIRMLSEGDSKFTHIKATEAVLELVSSTSLQYLSLFTSPAKTYRVEIYRGVDPIWNGWINPEYYTEPFFPAPHIVTVHATDGIAELKNVSLTVPVGTFKNSVIYYIAECLKMIGLPNTMTIKVALHMSATTTADGSVTARLLEKLFIDYRTFRTGQGSWTCYEILENILSTFNARLYQYADSWHIERIDHKWEAFDVEIYDHDGVYSGTSANYDAVTSLTAHSGKGTDIRFLSGASLELQPAYKGFTVEQEYGQRNTILPFSNFEAEFLDEDFTDDSTLRYWKQDDGTETALVEKTVFEDSTVLKMLPIPYGIGQVPAFTAYILPKETGSPPSHYTWTYNEGGTNENAVMAWVDGIGSLHLKFSAFANIATFRTVTPLKSFVKILCDFSGTFYQAWFDTDDITHYEWVEIGSTSGTYAQNHISVTLPKSTWYEADIVLSPPEAETSKAQTYIGFNVMISSPNLSEGSCVSGDGILYKGIQLYFTDDRDDAKTRTADTTISDDNILDPETYSFKYGDTPIPYDTDGCGLVNKYVIFDRNGNAVNLFGDGLTHTLSLYSQIIPGDLNKTYRQPLFKLRGTIIDTTLQSGVATGLDFRTILKDYDNRYYFPTGLAYNLLDSTFEGEWLQMYDGSGTGGEFNSDFSDDFWT